MARVIDKHLGAVKGKVGDVIFRQKGRLNFVSPAPQKSRKVKTPIDKAEREKFTVLSRFASAINSSSTLFEIWDKYDRNYLHVSLSGIKTPYNKIISSNHKLVGKGFLSLDVMLTPSAFLLHINSYNIERSIFEIEFDADNDIVRKYASPCYFFGLLYLSHPLNEVSSKGAANHRFVLLKAKSTDFIFSPTGNSFSFPVGIDGLKIIDDFEKVTVFFSFACKLENKRPVCSNAQGFILKGHDIHDSEVTVNERILEFKKIREEKKNIEEPDYKIIFK
ncbi:MAG: hypothetical protein WC139_13105 [Candidatus Kapaibacterium sp.]